MANNNAAAVFMQRVAGRDTSNNPWGSNEGTAAPWRPAMYPAFQGNAPAAPAAPTVAAAAKPLARNAFPTSFSDPVYEQADAAAAQATGVPLNLLRSIRLQGERSNANQVSSKGARTPYQFIPSTRKAFAARGLDPYASPQNAAMAAALHLKGDWEKTGSYEAAVAGYNGGIAARDAVAAGRAPPAKETQDYLTRVMGAMGNGSGMSSGFDPSMYGPALAGYDNAMQQAMQQTTQTFNPGAMPEAPAAFDAPTKDFSAQDALLGKMAPKAFSEEDGHNLQRRRLWQGAAQALGSLSEDAGVGSILARVGAGMLGGRLSADDEIQSRVEKYDSEMRAYNALLFNQEGSKAQAKFEEATTEAQAAHDRATKVWSLNLDQWGKNNTAEFDGNAFVTKTQAADGQITIKRTPIAALILPAMQIDKARLQAQIGNQANDAAMGVASTLRSAIVGTASQLAAQSVLQADQTEADNGTGVLLGTGVLATQAVMSGIGRDVVGDAVWDGFNAAARIHAGMGPKGTPETSDQHEMWVQFMAGHLMEDVIHNEDTKKRFMEKTPMLSGLRRANATITEKTKAGNTTSTVRY